MDPTQTFVERGCLAFQRLFDPALIDSIRAEYEDQLGGRAMSQLPPHLKVGNRRTQVPIRLKGAVLDPMLSANPLLMKLFESLLGPDLLIDSFTCVVAFPGAADQPLHRDHYELFPESPREGRNVFAITLAVPLVDLSEETGTTRLYPGSHIIATAPDGSPPKLGEPELPFVARGGCYLMDYRLWHQGSPNRSGSPRPILYMIYARPWFIDLTNFKGHARLLLDERDARSMPPEQRRLFRRIAAKDALDITEADLMGAPSG